MSHVFISYLHEDGERVDRLRATLRAFKIEVWIDRVKIRPGDRWATAIHEAIREGAFYLACFSSIYNARESTYLDTELAIAIKQLGQRPADKAWLIPVLLDACEIPDLSVGTGETLRSFQWVNLYENWDEGIAHLLSAIQPDSGVIFDLEKQLDNQSARARIAALDQLAIIGSQAKHLTPKLLEMLRDPNETVKRAAIGAITAVVGPTPAAIRAILKMLAQTTSYREGTYAARAARHALRKFGQPAVEILLEEAKSNTAAPEYLQVVSHLLESLQPRFQRNF